MRCDTPLPLYAPVHILDDLHQFLQLRTYLIDGLFLNQKTNNNIQISYSLKYQHSKKEYILYEKIKSMVQCQLYFVWGLILQRKTPA